MDVATSVAETVSVEKTAPIAGDRPWLFGLMTAPTGALANGLLQGGALAYLPSVQGVGSGGQSHVLALLDRLIPPVAFIKQRSQSDCNFCHLSRAVLEA